MNKADIERQILEGPTLEVAISVDTCIYQQHGFRLESGQLRHLEQFSGTPGVMVMSDVVQHEVLAHMVTEAVKAKRSEEHTSELQSPCNLVCRLLLEKKKIILPSTSPCL